MGEMSSDEWFGRKPKTPEAPKKNNTVKKGDAWAHQAKALEVSQSVSELALLWEMGTGKSRAVIDILRYRFAAHDRLLKTVIFSPKITLVNWQREWAKYSKVHPRDVVVLTGSGAKRVKQFIEAVEENSMLSKPKIIITNYEAVQMDKLFALLMDYAPEVVVGDEIHRIKNPQSKRGKKVIQLADKAMYRYALTGSLITNTGMDMWNVYRFLDKGKTFGDNFWAFQSQWFEDYNARWKGEESYYPDWRPRPETYQKLQALLYTKAIRALKKDCLDLPPLVRKEIHVELSAEQRRLYDEMKKEYIAYIDDIKKTDNPRAVVAQMAVTKSLRLMQILTGYAKDEDGNIHKIKDNPRLDALEELLEDLRGQKVIVWSVFHENYADIAALCKKLKLNYVELHGKITGKTDKKDNKQIAIDEFNNNPEIDVMIANQGAGGIGVNLVVAPYMIYYSKGYSLEQDEQSEARNHRGGSEIHDQITRIDLIATGTLDETVNIKLEDKKEISKLILDIRGDEL
jgi:SNF2 family DNA or RNA helicase